MQLHCVVEPFGEFLKILLIEENLVAFVLDTVVGRLLAQFGYRHEIILVACLFDVEEVGAMTGFDHLRENRLSEIVRRVLQAG